MRRDIHPDAPDGLYRVDYTACWPDGSCHEGHFEFFIDSQQTATYQDWRSQGEVTIRLAGIAFVPEFVIISRGTRVTWVNDDGFTHYVNTDSHPAHTYYPTMNSQALRRGDTYVLTFDTPGIYPYHCSAHTNMTGAIIVE